MEVVKTELLVRQLGKDNARKVGQWLETLLWELKNKVVELDDDQASLKHKYMAQQVRRMASDLQKVVDAG